MAKRQIIQPVSIEIRKTHPCTQVPPGVIGDHLGSNGIDHKLRRTDAVYYNCTRHQKILQMRLSAISALVLHLTLRYERHEV